MNSGGGSDKRELALPPGSYAYVQDESKGPIKTYVGPTVINQTAQDRPVIYDHNTRTFRPVELSQAVRQFIFANEGEYVVLENPSQKGAYPTEGTADTLPDLLMGEKKIVPGPVAFALYPGQWATTVPGHNLRSNEYLVVRIYNEQKAKENWSKAVMKAATKTGEEGEEEEATVATKTAEELKLTTGQLLIIKGTDVSFYLPPTGVEVLKDPETGNYTRKAVTLERLEYCILIDEDGNKRYEKGPKVVFPKPTEVFFTKDGNRKFRAIELSGPIQGLHIKVIQGYQDGESTDGKAHKEGDELFITGEDCAIYFPRPEHSIIKYGDKEKHYATAVPEGEGRYVMDRLKGVIDTKKGPDMLLPDPRFFVIVRRILTANECALWYPGNQEAAVYNASLRAMSGGGTANFVADEAVRAKSGVRTRGVASRSAGAPDMAFSASLSDSLEAYMPEGAGSAEFADQFTRSQTYTQPRTVTLDTKYDGVPKIKVWTGFAIMVVKADGKRRVEQGPKTILLDYDETLEVLELSTGKPKTTDDLKKTVYLRIKNNKVSDIIRVDTKDHAPIDIKLSFRVDFEGDPELWFDSDNYVKLLCDHVRSMLKGAIRQKEVEDFYSNGEAIIRDIILGAKDAETGERELLRFKENGMVVKDVEVLSVQIMDSGIAQMLADAQRRTVEQNISVNRAEKDLKVTKRLEEIEQDKARAAQQTATLKNQLSIQRIEEQAQVALATVKADLDKVSQDKELKVAEESLTDISSEAALERRKKTAAQDQAEREAALKATIEELEAETKAVVEKFAAAQPAFAECILALSNADTLTKIAQAHSVGTLIGGESVVDALKKIFGDGALQDGLGTITQRMKGGRPTVASSRD